MFPERFPSLPFVRNVEIAVMTSAILPAVACPKRKKRLSGLVFRLFPLAEANAILPAAVLNKARKLRACRSSVCLVEIRIKMCKRKIYKVIKRKLFVALCSERNALRIDRLMRMFRFPSARLCRRRLIPFTLLLSVAVLCIFSRKRYVPAVWGGKTFSPILTC